MERLYAVPASGSGSVKILVIIHAFIANRVLERISQTLEPKTKSRSYESAVKMKLTDVIGVESYEISKRISAAVSLGPSHAQMAV